MHGIIILILLFPYTFVYARPQRAPDHVHVPMGPTRRVLSDRHFPERLLDGGPTADGRCRRFAIIACNTRTRGR